MSGTQPRETSRETSDCDALSERDVDRLVEFERTIQSDDDPTEAIKLDCDDALSPLMRCVGMLECYRRRQRSDGGDDGDVSPDAIPSADLPRDFGRYRLERSLGHGASGIVFLATDVRLDRAVAVKILRPESIFFTELRERFFREARATARLRHPHLVQIYEVGEQESVPYLASAYCSGGTLEDWIEMHGPASPRVAADLVEQLAAAVQHAHARGILHRDIKPSNVLIDPEAPRGDRPAPHVRLTDFGLARFLDEASRELTRDSAPIGTAAYMAPEQAAGRADDTGVHSDIWSLGVILHELLTGEALVGGSTSSEIVRRLVNGSSLPFRNGGDRIPRDLQAICRQCLAF
ncbi:MAG: serine/threonine-protein kinase, partial [Planctomycetota bacterium]